MDKNKVIVVYTFNPNVFIKYRTKTETYTGGKYGKVNDSGDIALKGKA